MSHRRGAPVVDCPACQAGDPCEVRDQAERWLREHDLVPPWQEHPHD